MYPTSSVPLLSERETLSLSLFKQCLDCLTQGCLSRNTRFLLNKPFFLNMMVNLSQLLRCQGIASKAITEGSDIHSIRDFFHQKILHWFNDVDSHRMSSHYSELFFSSLLYCEHFFSSPIFRLVESLISYAHLDPDIAVAFGISLQEKLGEFQICALSLLFQFFEAFSEASDIMLYDPQRRGQRQYQAYKFLNSEEAQDPFFIQGESYFCKALPRSEVIEFLEGMTLEAFDPSALMAMKILLSALALQGHSQRDKPVLLLHGGLSVETMIRFSGRSPFLFPEYLLSDRQVAVSGASS